LTGSVPLRSFGQLKQLWQAKATGDEPEAGAAEPGAEAPESGSDKAPETQPSPPPAPESTEQG
ncbi:MAG: hypothetical protein AB7I30_18280, partial [Isosphaeraceae bacterium]